MRCTLCNRPLKIGSFWAHCPVQDELASAPHYLRLAMTTGDYHLPFNQYLLTGTSDIKVSAVYVPSSSYRQPPPIIRVPFIPIPFDDRFNEVAEKVLKTILAFS